MHTYISYTKKNKNKLFFYCLLNIYTYICTVNKNKQKQNTMKNPIVPQEIIDNLDILRLKEWCRILDVWHNKTNSSVQTFVISEGWNGEVFQDKTLHFRLQQDNKVRKIKFKNINNIFTFYER